MDVSFVVPAASSVSTPWTCAGVLGAVLMVLLFVWILQPNGGCEVFVPGVYGQSFQQYPTQPAAGGAGQGERRPTKQETPEPRWKKQPTLPAMTRNADEEDGVPNDLYDVLHGLHSPTPSCTPGSMYGKSAWAL